MKSALAALALIALGGCAPQVAPAVFAPEACRRLALIDAATGAPVSGIEDGVFDATSRTIYVSAYDRLAVERARANPQAQEPPAGGVYAIEADQLHRSSLRVHDLLGPLLPAPARPHGIDAVSLGADQVRLAIINRAVLRSRENRDWQLRAEVEIVDVSAMGESLVSRILSPSLCSANDLAFRTPETLQITLDRGQCLEDGRAAVGGPALAIVSTDGATSTRPAAAAFPNGAAHIGNSFWFSSTTRGQLVSEDDQRRVNLPGAPDNLTLDAQARLIVALHPQLWRFAFYRHGWPGFSSAPTRIIRFDPARRSMAVLFDDATGRTFSGATFGLMAGSTLVMGGVRERGLLICSNLPSKRGAGA